MDHLRKTLNQLMGKDRDLPLKERMAHSKHFDAPEVCKYYLIGFCPHDLFPNTKSDLGECKKRHDQQFKIMFDKDPNKDQYQQKYEDHLMDFLETKIAEVDNKMKKCVERIEAPIPEQELNQDTQENINIIEQKINDLIQQAEHFGEIGMVTEAEEAMKNIEQLKNKKSELLAMNDHPLMFKEKQMKVCEVCGAMQSTQDNEKRLQTHVEGKLHSGYLKIRKYLDTLRKRKLERKHKMEEERQKEKLERKLREKEREDKEKEKKRKRSSHSRSRDYRDRDKDYYRDKYKERERRDRDRSRERSREQERERERHRDRTRDRERERDRDRDRSYKDRRDDRDSGYYRKR